MSKIRGSRFVSLCLFASLSACVLLRAGDVVADPPAAAERTIAQDLFERARALMLDGKVAEACDKFAESFRLDPASGALLNLAVCHEKLGRTATAWSEYRDLEVMARKEGNQERTRIATQRAALLEPRLSRLSLLLSPAHQVDGEIVNLDNTIIGPAAWNTPAPVDPGSHRVVVSAPLHETWTASVEVASDAHIATLEIPKLIRTRVSAAPPPGPAPPADSGPTSHRSNTQRTWGWIVGGAGLVSLGASGYFAYDTRAKLSDAEPYCSAQSCSEQRGVDLHHDAVRSADLATVFGCVGVAGLAAGAVLLWTSADDSTVGQPSSHLQWQVGAGPGQALLGGSW